MQKFSEELYKDAGANAVPAAAGGEAPGADSAEAAPEDDENVIDADFDMVDEDGETQEAPKEV